MAAVSSASNLKRIRSATVWLLVILVLPAGCQRTPQAALPSPTGLPPATSPEVTRTLTATAVLSPTFILPTPGGMPITTVTATAVPTTTSPVTAAAKCLGAAGGGGNPPQNTQDLHIQINLPLQAYEPVLAFFKQIARPCDGLGLLGRFAGRAPWQDLIGDLPNGYVFYSLPSLQTAQETADTWTNDVDWFAYEMTLAERTPGVENSTPAQTSQAALQFAREHGLGYFVTPGRPVTKRYAAELAQYADAYGLQAHGELRASPATFIQLVKDTSQQIRAVKPDILLFISVNTDQPDDDPQATYDVITQLLGYIDGVFIVTSGEPNSMEKLQTLVSLLREE